ncbi:MAG: hypothetical protein AAF253_02810 [Pseudomonadota bacterium]
MPADPASTALPIAALQRLWVGAILVGLALVPITLAAFGAIPDVEFVPAIIAAATGGCGFGGVFFLGVNLVGVRFESRVRDETRVSGANVDHITHVAETGDRETDRWLSRYVFARSLFGGLLIPLLLFVGVFWFA